MVKDIRSPIWLDIETGGIDPSNSSILSIASGQGRDIRSTFARPVAGTFLSSFSEKNILPQLSGKSLLSEKQSIESLIQQLENNPRTPIAGFNIRGFDMGFIQRRARTYGLEKRFLQTTRGRELVDPVYQVKDIVASAISKHADIGTFKSALEGKSWSEAETSWSALPFEKRPTEYNLIAQVKGYLQADRESAMFKGWKLEDLYKLLPEQSQLAGQAHEAATDILMTQRLTQATRSGELEQELAKPVKAFQWMETVKARGYHQFGPGRLLAQTDIEKMGLSVPRWYQKSSAKIIGAGIAGALALAAFSGKDDEYNTIEGLPHGGFAQSGRLQLTDFGSGYTAKTIRELAELAAEVPKKNFFSLIGVKEIDSVFLSEIGGGLNMDLSLSERMMAHVPAELHSLARENIEAITSQGFGTGAYVTRNVDRDIIKFADELFGLKLPKPANLDEISKVVGFHEATELKNMRAIDPGMFIKLQSQGIHASHHMAIVQEELFMRTMSADTRGFFKKFREVTDPWFSGFDDKYNTVEGLRHGGISEYLRHVLTDFGSGWKGQYQLSNRLAKFMFTEGGGLARKLAFEGVQVNKGGAETIFKSFREAIENKYTGAGLFGRISKQLDMRALRKAESFMQDRHAGAFIAPKSYIRNAARAQGISPRKLEAGVRSHEGFHLGTVELGLRNQIEDMADIVPLEFAREMQKIPAYQANPMAVTEEYLAYSQTAKHTGRTPFGVDYTPANQRIQELIQQHPRLKEFVNPIMSGKDDAHNVIEGMNHKGIAHRLRRLFTPFGSGWDALRGLAKGAETFQDMISSSGFQKALSSAVEVKQLGKGAMGTASLMKGSFRGKEFQFVRKQGILGESEAATMKTLQDKFAPTVYSSSEKHIDMELFEGRTASQLLKEGKLTPTNVRDIEKSVEEMHQVGLSHGDYHAGNIMVTPEGRIGAIDFGASGPIGSSGLTKLADDQGNIVEGFYGGYTRATRKQHGKWTPEPIQIRDPEYDWGRIGQMKERMAKLQAAQPQATATSIMTGSASINTASGSMGTATGTINENTMLAVTKKVRHANLQRSAVASTWVAGKNGGKRSRL